MPMLAVKFAGCVIALFFVFSVLWALIATAVDEGKYSGDAYHLDWCEREYIGTVITVDYIIRWICMD